MRKIVFMALLASGMYLFAQSNEQTLYFEQCITKSASSMQLSKQTKQQIQTSYNSLCKSNTDKPDYLLYRMAVNSVYSDTATLYLMFKFEIDNAVKFKQDKFLAEYKTKYNLSADQLLTVRDLAYQQARQTHLLYYLYPGNMEQLEKEKKTLMEKFKNKVKQTFSKEIKQTDIANYCNEQFAANQTINTLNKTKKQQIIDKFNELSTTLPETSKHKLYKKAVCSVVNDTTLIYAIFKDDIESEMLSQQSTIANAVKMKYELTDEQLNTVMSIINQQAKEFQLAEYVFQENKSLAKSTKDNIAGKYKDQIMVALSTQGVETELTKYCKPLKYSDQLKLNPAQIKNLTQVGLDAYSDSLFDKGNKKNNTAIHLKVKETLNKEQYEKYLSIEVAGKAQQRTTKVWDEMKQLQLTANLDSVFTCSQLLPYYTERYKIQERYSIIPNSKTEKNTQLTLLRNNRPTVLKKMEAEIKRQKKNSTQNINSLIW